MSREFDSARTPDVIKNIGAVFIAYSPQIVAYALEHYEMKDSGKLVYPEAVYRKLGYTISRDKVNRPPKPWP
jgi:hypothetical protein